MLVQLLQKERQVSLERLAILFAQPIQFESHRRNLQRFLILPQLTAEALFPYCQILAKQYYRSAHPLLLVIDRTQWKMHNPLHMNIPQRTRGS